MYRNKFPSEILAKIITDTRRLTAQPSWLH